MSILKGYPSQEKEDRATQEAVTVNPVNEFRHAIDVLSHTHVQLVVSDAAEAGSSDISIEAAGHVAFPGDMIKFTSGTHSGVIVSVSGTTATSIDLGQKLSSTIGVGDAFEILRFTHPLVSEAGRLQVDIISQNTPNPLALQLDDTGVGGVSYVGEADPGSATGVAVWRIKRLTELNNDISVEWADGDGDFDNIWDDRAILTYS